MIASALLRELCTSEQSVPAIAMRQGAENLLHSSSSRSGAGVEPMSRPNPILDPQTIPSPGAGGWGVVRQSSGPTQLQPFTRSVGRAVWTVSPISRHCTSRRRIHWQ